MMNIPQSSFKDISLFQLTGAECTEKLKSALKSVNYTTGTDIGMRTLHSRYSNLLCASMIMRTKCSLLFLERYFILFLLLFLIRCRLASSIPAVTRLAKVRAVIEMRAFTIPRSRWCVRQGRLVLRRVGPGVRHPAHGHCARADWLRVARLGEGRYCWSGLDCSCSCFFFPHLYLNVCFLVIWLCSHVRFRKTEKHVHADQRCDPLDCQGAISHLPKDSLWAREHAWIDALHWKYECNEWIMFCFCSFLAQTNLLTEIYYIFQNPETKLIDRYLRLTDFFDCRFVCCCTFALAHFVQSRLGCYVEEAEWQGILDRRSQFCMLSYPLRRSIYLRFSDEVGFQDAWWWSGGICLTHELPSESPQSGMARRSDSHSPIQIGGTLRIMCGREIGDWYWLIAFETLRFCRLFSSPGFTEASRFLPFTTCQRSTWWVCRPECWKLQFILFLDWYAFHRLLLLMKWFCSFSLGRHYLWCCFDIRHHEGGHKQILIIS